MLNIVLIHPEIPNNTGNIGRLCIGTNCHLHLVHPLGFEITDKQLKRSGLDYWPHLKLTEYKDFESWKAQLIDKSRVFLFTSNTQQSFLDVEYQDNDWLVFGRESKGLESEILEQFKNHVLIPNTGKVRSFNIANAVSFGIGEALRQINSFRF